MRRLWNFIWQPTARFGFGFLLLLGGVAGVIFWGGFNTAMEATNTMTFCLSCHEMRDTVYEEYKKTVHYSNPSGVRAICSDCHVPDPWVHKFVRKVYATRELYHKAVGTISTREKFEARRAILAKRVWASMEATDSRECRNCHSYEAMDFHGQSKKASDSMQKAVKKGETCISCHKGIAHKLPDLSSGYKSMFEDLKALATKEGGKTDVLYTIASKPVYQTSADVKANTKSVGKLLPATKLSVVERGGGALKVRIDGWQQDGVERVIYALMGHRIFSIVLSKSAVDQIQRHETKLDSDTDLTWHRVSVDVWTSPDDSISDLKKLWDYGSEMYNASCSVCHTLTSPDHFLANQWIGNLKAMKRFIALDKEQYRFLQKYLQFHASDTGGKNNASH